MEKSLKTFIANLRYCTGYYPIGHYCKWLKDEEILKLKNLNILKKGSDLLEVACDSCDEAHFTRIFLRNGSLTTVCSTTDHTPRVLEETEVQTWTFDCDSFLQQMAVDLGMTNSVELLAIKGMWQVGSFSKDDTNHTCYFYYGRDFKEALEFIKKQPPSLRRYIIITSRQEAGILATEHQFLRIEVESLVDFKGRSLKFSRKALEDQLMAGFRSIQFNESNGDLTVNGEVIVTIQPSSIEYYFTQYLWQAFNEPRTHKSLSSYIYQKTRQEYADPSGKFCNKLKASIKKKSKRREVIDAIFATTKNIDGENSYIMRNDEK